MIIYSSYNEINGIPNCVNRELLTDLLRDTWNFTGYVTSDCGAVPQIYTDQHAILYIIPLYMYMYQQLSIPSTEHNSFSQPRSIPISIMCVTYIYMYWF